MLVDLTTTAGQNFVKKCIWNKYSNEGTTRTLSLYARFFFWDVNGQYTNEEGFKYNSIVFDQSSIKSFNFTSSLGSSDKFTVGNFPVTTLSLSVFTNSLIEFGESGGGIEIYFSPFQSGSGLSSYLESLSPGKKISATYSDYVVRLGTFYQTNYSYAPYTNVQTFEAVDYLGRPGLADTPYHSSLAYPATLLDITVEAIRLAGFETVNGISSFNIGDITVNEAPEGYTCKDIISMAASCAGANVKKVNRFYDDPVPGGGALYDSNYDSYIAFVYPSGMEYSDIPLGSSIFNAIDMNHLAIMRTMDIYSESGNDGDHNTPIEAVRYCGVKANYTPIYEAKYGNSLDISSNPFFDSLGSAALATKLRNIAQLYVIFPFMPGTIKTNSCFAFECGDFVEQRFYVNGIYDHGRYHILTSINISSMSTMSIKSPGKYERDTSETGSNTQSQTTRAMQAGQISKLNDQVATLEKYIDVGNNSLGIGEPAATNNIPANGRADFGMDAHFNAEVYDQRNKKLSILTPYHITTTNTLSSAGWYRAYKITFGTHAQSTGARGTCIDFVFGSVYNNSNNTVHRILLYGYYSGMEFKDETSKGADTTAISKIRYMTDGNGVGYIDIYYNLSTANDVNGSIFAIDSEGIASIEDMGFASVGPAPYGETLRAEYTFKSNYNEYDDRYYKVGDTTTIAPGIIQGLVLSSGKLIRMNFTLPKRLSAVSSVSISNLTGGFANHNGLVETSGYSTNFVSSSTYTVTATIREATAGILTIDVSKSTAFVVYGGSAVPQNTPITGFFTTLSLTFS